MPAPLRIEKICTDYWTVYGPDGAEIGTVLGGGPTAATRYKCISRSGAGMNPETAPGGYAPSRAKAAEMLRPLHS